jgi:hypothetical protein
MLVEGRNKYPAIAVEDLTSSITRPLANSQRIILTQGVHLPREKETKTVIKITNSVEILLEG